MPEPKGDQLIVNVGAAEAHRRLKGFGHGVRKVGSAGTGQAVIVHSASGQHLRELEAKFADVGFAPPAAGLCETIEKPPPGAASARRLLVEPHPLLDLKAFVTEFPVSLGQFASSAELLALLSSDAPAPLRSSDEVRAAARDLLRHGGFKPTGRSKPASEYLIQAAQRGTLSSINLAVDACNAASLHSGLPISVVDLDLAREPLRVAIAPPGAAYVFNPAGQTIDVGGLLCLFDSEGPCANAVKDAQRTKTHPGTCRTLSLIWGTTRLPGRAAETAAWYQKLLAAHEATVEVLL
jgi:DNA/RNA-binding domain of Phe-tRNA-synthetase-like protein